MSIPKVYADFQNLDDFNRLRLTCKGTQSDLDAQGIRLQEGLALTLYTDDADRHGRRDELRLDGIVQYDEAAKCWVAEVDWTALRHASDEHAHGGPGPNIPSDVSPYGALAASGSRPIE